VAGVAAVAAGLYLCGSVAVAALAMAAVWTVQLGVQDRPAAARVTAVRPRWERRWLVPLVRLALPAGVVSSLGSLAVSLPRFAIDRDLGAGPLGQFATMAYALVAVTQPMLALGAAIAPRLGQFVHADRAAYRTLTRHAVLLALAFGGVVVAATAIGGRPFLALAYGGAYAADRAVFVWLALAAAVGFVASALGAAVTAARRLGEQALAAGVTVAVCALASWLLVPRYGLVGAAWAVLASETSRLGCLAAIYALAARGHAVAPAALPLVGAARPAEASR
jgi:O-antigen/teichoic acid export membrane protein